MATILLVDDDATLATELRTLLGGTVVVAHDAAEANEKLASPATFIDFIALAVELPRGNGFVLCNKLKKDARLARIPLLLMTKEATDETLAQHKRLKTHADEYLRKPFDPKELVAVIRRHLGATREKTIAISPAELEEEATPKLVVPMEETSTVGGQPWGDFTPEDTRVDLKLTADAPAEMGESPLPEDTMLEEMPIAPPAVDTEQLRALASRLDQLELELTVLRRALQGIQAKVR